MLSLYERYINQVSDNAYTQAIGIVDKAKELPIEYDSVMKKMHLKNKRLDEIMADDQLR